VQPTRSLLRRVTRLAGRQSAAKEVHRRGWYPAELHREPLIVSVRPVLDDQSMSHAHPVCVGDGETSAQGREHALHGGVFGVDGNVTGLAARHRHVRDDEVALSNYFVYSEDQLREGRAQPQGRCVEACRSRYASSGRLGRGLAVDCLGMPDGNEIGELPVDHGLHGPDGGVH